MAENKNKDFSKLLEAGSNLPILAVRLLISAIIAVLCSILSLPAILEYILLILAVAIAGYDVVLSAADDFENSRYFSTSVIILIAAVLSFVTGFGFDAVLLVIVYHLSRIGLDYALNNVELESEEYVSGLNDSMKNELHQAAASAKENNSLSSAITSSAEFVLKIGAFFAVVFAIAVPIFTVISFRDSIHRAMVILVLCQPASVAVALPVVLKMSVYSAGTVGAVVYNSDSFEALSSVNCIVVDKPGIITSPLPKVTGTCSEVISEDTFLTFAAHASYYSEQNFAKAVSSAYTQDFRTELISGFSEETNRGISVKIGNAAVLLGSDIYLRDNAVAVPDIDRNPDCIYIFMSVAGRYIGYITLDNSVSGDAGSLASDARNSFAEECILISSDDSESQAYGLDYDRFIQYTDVAGKAEVLDGISSSDERSCLFVYNEGIEKHSSCAVDIRVGNRARFADILLLPSCISNLCLVKDITDNAVRLIKRCAIGAFAIKAILMFLGIIGFAHVWFALLIDAVAAGAAILYAMTAKLK